MSKPKPAAQADDTPAASPAVDAVTSAETSLAAPASSEPDSRSSPPDNNGDGRAGGRDRLEPYAVLLAPLGQAGRGHVVYGPRDDIDALVDAGQARAATETDIAIAGVHVRPLHPLTPET